MTGKFAKDVEVVLQGASLNGVSIRGYCSCRRTMPDFRNLIIVSHRRRPARHDVAHSHQR